MQADPVDDVEGSQTATTNGVIFGALSVPSLTRDHMSTTYSTHSIDGCNQWCGVFYRPLGLKTSKKYEIIYCTLVLFCL